jgi:hypothetical protein
VPGSQHALSVSYVVTLQRGVGGASVRCHQSIRVHAGKRSRLELSACIPSSGEKSIHSVPARRTGRYSTDGGCAVAWIKKNQLTARGGLRGYSFTACWALRGELTSKRESTARDPCCRSGLTFFNTKIRVIYRLEFLRSSPRRP